MKGALVLTLLASSAVAADKKDTFEIDKAQYREAFMQQARSDYEIVLNRPELLTPHGDSHDHEGGHDEHGEHEHKEKVASDLLGKIAEGATDCHMQTMAGFPETLQRQAYAVAGDGGSYQEANKQFVEALAEAKKNDLALEDLSNKLIATAQQCIGKVLTGNLK